MKQVRAKKHLGQHFLTDKSYCERIAHSISKHRGCNRVLEIGPGMGALTEFLLKRGDLDVRVLEIDTESVAYLQQNYPDLNRRIHQGDFLKQDLNEWFSSRPTIIAGNFPYNISSQILFKCLDYKDLIPEITGMFQKEVAERIAEKPGSKQYGILSVLLQAFYDIAYCFTVEPGAFNPPPKVFSGVIRCTRNHREKLDCDEKLFKQVVKMGFNQRRKTLRNSLKPLLKGDTTDPVFSNRPEQLSVDDFIRLTLLIQQQ